MLDLSLAEYFGTIALSLFIVLSFWVLFHILYRMWGVIKGHKTKNFYQIVTNVVKVKNDIGNHIFFPIFIATFCFGIIIELHTDYFTDSTTTQSNIRRFSNSCIDSLCCGQLREAIYVPDEMHLRLSVLVDKDTFLRKDCITSLGRSVFGDSSLRDNGDIKDIQNLQLLQDYLKSADTTKPMPSQITRDVLADLSSEIYYSSKNWCYSQPNYFVELRNIERRVQFSRSLAEISFLCMLITLALLLLSVIYGLFHFLFLSLAKRRSASSIRPYFTEVLKLCVPLIMFCFIYYLSLNAYTVTVKNFTERTYGYYISYIHNMKYFKDQGFLLPIK